MIPGTSQHLVLQWGDFESGFGGEIGIIKQMCLLLSTAVYRADPGGTGASLELYVLFTSLDSECSGLLTLWLISQCLNGLHAPCFVREESGAVQYLL